MPLWSGARLYSNYMHPLDNSKNMDDGYAFYELRQPKGVKTIALGQSFWLGKNMLVDIAAGQFHYDVRGVQAQASMFMPGGGDLVRARAVGYTEAPGGIAGNDSAGAISYRHLWNANTTIEAGVQRYSDGTSGPTVEWTRWFADFSMQILYRKGGEAQFAGIQLSVPLTPRQGMQPGSIFVTGTAQQSQLVRTRITDDNQQANLVQPRSVRDMQLEGSADVRMLNMGRMSQIYLESQAQRMRAAFNLYGRGQLN